MASKAGAAGEKLASEASESASATLSTASNTSASLTDLAAPLTDDSYEKLIIALAPCKIEYGKIDIACPAQHTFADAQNRAHKANVNLGPMSNRAGKKLLDHAEPSVRVEAIQLLSLMFDKDHSIPDLLIAAANKEKNPSVLRALVRVLGTHAVGDEKVQAALLTLAENPDAAVRADTGEVLSMHKNRSIAAGVKKVGDLMLNDPVWVVRTSTCQRAGMLGDESLLPIYEKLTTSAIAAKDPKLAASCITGLSRMWMPIANWDSPSEKAYRLTLKLLARKQRSEWLPSVDLIMELGMTDDASLPGHEQWVKKATWWKSEELRSILASIVVDEHASMPARVNAIDSIVRLGGTPASLLPLRKSLGDKPAGDSARVAAKLDLVTTTKK